MYLKIKLLAPKVVRTFFLWGVYIDVVATYEEIVTQLQMMIK